MPKTSIDLDALARETLDAMPTLDVTEQRVAVELYRLLAEGEPVSPERLAQRVGVAADRVALMLEGWPGVFFDDGDVVGFWGLALPEMPHRFEVDGRRLHVWCAWDSLFIPQILGKPARVASTCATTGAAVSLTVGPERVDAVSPPGTVLSFLRPDRGVDTDVIQHFCHSVLFFASEDAGRAWTARRSDTFLLTPEEGFELGRLWVHGNFGAVLPAGRRPAAR